MFLRYGCEQSNSTDFRREAMFGKRKGSLRLMDAMSSRDVLVMGSLRLLLSLGVINKRWISYVVLESATKVTSHYILVRVLRIAVSFSLASCSSWIKMFRWSTRSTCTYGGSTSITPVPRIFRTKKRTDFGVDF